MSKNVIAPQQWAIIEVLKRRLVFVSSDPDESALRGWAGDVPEHFGSVAYQHATGSSDPLFRASLKQQLNNRVEIKKDREVGRKNSSPKHKSRHILTR